MDLANFENKKILIFGLGILGGGVSVVKWLSKIKGVKIKITDLKSRKELKESLEKIKDIKVQSILGKHRKSDIDWADIVIVNPAVSKNNPFVNYAIKNKKIVLNDCLIFFNLAPSSIIAITGTRGKTTTSSWIYYFMKNYFKNKNVYICGNQPQNPLLKILPKLKKEDIAIAELSSFQLEFCNQKLNKNIPKIAIITNILEDHLNRYKNIKDYIKAKSNIFYNQSHNDYLILNKDNKWTKFILKFKPKSKILFVSKNKMKNDGIYINKNYIFIQEFGVKKRVLNIKSFLNYWGEHNLYNLLFTILTCYIFKIPIKDIKKLIKTLPKIKFREEIIYKRKGLIIINDSSATSPDATINAIKRFKNKNLILITGGTDKKLNFKDLAKIIKRNLKKENLILLNGSATKKLIRELKNLKYNVLEENICEKLKDCLSKALERGKNYKLSIILFSPASASFEKFKNEFDRGKKFNRLVYNLLK